MSQRTSMAARGSKPDPGRSASRSSGLRRLAASVGRGVGRRPGLVLVTVALVGGVGVFSWNALMRQPTRHPAPLFASSAVVAKVEPPRRPDTTGVPLPVPRPDIGVAAARPSPEPVRANTGNDPIGALIRSSDPGARAADPKAAPAPRVVAVQKALSKLGYGPLAADGVMGTTTRQAIEKFERDRSLPVTGAPGQRTVKQLAQLSGLQVE